MAFLPLRTRYALQRADTKLDKYVYLDQKFRAWLGEADLLVCPRTDDSRSLYSLRHFYITQAILSNKTNPTMIAKQCGTSILMLEKQLCTLRHLEAQRGTDELMDKKQEFFEQAKEAAELEKKEKSS